MSADDSGPSGASPPPRSSSAPGDASASATATRTWIARGYALVEDAVYVGLGVLLAATVVALLVQGFSSFVGYAWQGSIGGHVVTLLDQILLILLLVELLYTVQVSFRSHRVTAEPFLLVGLISAIRRVLVLTAEMGHQKNGTQATTLFLAELAVLSVLVVAMAVSLVLLRRVQPPADTRRAPA
jgi:uncharacterized membrane protein (DUF373 family)